MSFTEDLDDLVAANENGLLCAHPTWERVRLADVSVLLNGFPFASGQFSSSGGTPLIRIRDVLRGWTETHFVGEYDPEYIVRRGELVVGMDGDFNCAVWAGEKALLNQRVCKLTIDEKFYDPRLLVHALQGYLSAINAKTSAITVKHLSSKTMQDIPLPLPPRHEQARLVDSIESHFTRLSDAAATLERVGHNLDRYRASVLKAAVEGRLVSTEAELANAERRGYEPATVLLERIIGERRRLWEEAELASVKTVGKVPKSDKWRTRYEEPLDAETAALPRLPEGWCWATLSALIVSGPQNGLYVPRSRYVSGVPILRIDDFQVDWSRSSFELEQIDITPTEADRYGLNVGDLVVNRVNSPSHLGKSLAVLDRHLPAVFESNMMRFTPSPRVLPSYIQYYLTSSLGKARLTKNAKWAVNQASINQDDVVVTPVPLPPLTEQHRIVRQVDFLLSAAKEAARTTETSLGRCFRLRQSILKWAFAGRLVDQDPHEEPARALLERVRAERHSSKDDRPKHTVRLKSKAPAV